jgi:16S rRNA (cytosine967-C5)-methyltransferase
MASQGPITARTVAMAVLNRFEPERNYAGPILDKLLHKTSQKQRVTDLVFGTIRNRAAIDMVIARLADCPVERIPAKLLNIIRIGAYELIYSPATAEYSIVNEAVENAKAIAGKKQTNFVNALLRQISRHITNRQIPLSQANPRKTLPQTPLTGCEFDTDILPEPETSPTSYFSTAFSLPKWLVANWLSEFGAEKTKRICFASNRRPSIYLRPNTLKTTTAHLSEKFRQADIDFEILADETMLKIKSPRAVAQLPGFAEGFFTIQDITASQAVKALKPTADWTILDLCAAPGVKTTQLAELTNDSAKIIATDIDGDRLERVKENTARLGINSVRIVAYEELMANPKWQIENGDKRWGPFDAVLLDVPCSNTGVLAKRIEARYRIKPKAKQKLIKVQSELLEAATTMIKPEGRIAYSTCSIEATENSELVRDFLLENRNFELESELLSLPSAEEFGYDGGYVAIIIKKTDTK